MTEWCFGKREKILTLTKYLGQERVWILSSQCQKNRFKTHEPFIQFEKSVWELSFRRMSWLYYKNFIQDEALWMKGNFVLPDDLNEPSAISPNLVGVIGILFGAYALGHNQIPLVTNALSEINSALRKLSANAAEHVKAWDSYLIKEKILDWDGVFGWNQERYDTVLVIGTLTWQLDLKDKWHDWRKWITMYTESEDKNCARLVSGHKMECRAVVFLSRKSNSSISWKF